MNSKAYAYFHLPPDPNWFFHSLQARQIQREVRDRKELEYRLRAFTGDDVTSSYWGSKSKTKNAPKWNLLVNKIVV